MKSGKREGYRGRGMKALPYEVPDRKQGRNGGRRKACLEGPPSFSGGGADRTVTTTRPARGQKKHIVFRRGSAAPVRNELWDD